MKPISPVIPGQLWDEVVFAKDQPEYIPLPAIKTNDGHVISRWHMTWWERLRVLMYGDIYLRLVSFNKPLTPSNLSTKPPVLISEDSVQK